MQAAHQHQPFYSARVLVPVRAPRASGRRQQRDETLESLQSTLGAAYMLLAAEAKAESLQAELSEARGGLAMCVDSGDEMLRAHEQCVADYSDLRGVLDGAREQAEARAATI